MFTLYLFGHTGSFIGRIRPFNDDLIKREKPSQGYKINQLNVLADASSFIGNTATETVNAHTDTHLFKRIS